MATFFDARVALFESFTADEMERVRTCLRAWDIRPGMRVLEPGCGSGRLTALLVEAVGKDGEVCAIDLSKEMIRRAQQRGLPQQARFLQVPAAAVPSKAGYFDRVICCCVFPHFLEPAPVLAELVRVLKPGGRLVVQHLETRAAVSEFHRTVAANSPHRDLPTDDTMRRLLAEAGLVDIVVGDADGAYRAGGRKS
jgi:ubiquinone/menaquinone biosynthesis C-methylase UbiE